MLEDSKALLQNSEIQDKDRYVLNHKIEALQNLN